MKPNLLLGDCAEKMRDLADNSIDSIVTDPPYALTGSSGSGTTGLPPSKRAWTSSALKKILTTQR